VLGKLSATLEANGCCFSLFEETLPSSSKYIAKLSGCSGTGSHRHEAQAKLLMVYSDTHVLIFYGHTILNRGHHTEVTVSTVFPRHPPKHGHSKRNTTSFSVHPRVEFG